MIQPSLGGQRQLPLGTHREKTMTGLMVLTSGSSFCPQQFKILCGRSGGCISDHSMSVLTSHCPICGALLGPAPVHPPWGAGTRCFSSSSLTPTLTRLPLEPRWIGSSCASKPGFTWQVKMFYLIQQKCIMGYTWRISYEEAPPLKELTVEDGYETNAGLHSGAGVRME